MCVCARTCVHAHMCACAYVCLYVNLERGGVIIASICKAQCCNWLCLFIPGQFCSHTPITAPFKAPNSDVSAASIAWKPVALWSFFRLPLYCSGNIPYCEDFSGSLCYKCRGQIQCCLSHCHLSEWYSQAMQCTWSQFNRHNRSRTFGETASWPPHKLSLLARIPHSEPSLIVSVLLNLKLRSSNDSKVKLFARKGVETYSWQGLF